MTPEWKKKQDALRLTSLSEMFGVEKPVIAMVHLPPLPGAPNYDGQGMAPIIEWALRDVATYQQAGVDGLMVENMWDHPYFVGNGVPPEEMTGERLHDVMDLCISCKGCKAECPSNVDMARLKSEFLALYHAKHGYSLRERLFTQPDTAGRWGVATYPIANWLIRQQWFRALLENLAGIDRRRSLPPFAAQTFESWFRARAGKRSEKKVVLFHDTFMNYNEPDIGKAAVTVLEAAGYEVVLAKKACCGRPAISKGMLDRARSLARQNVDALAGFARDGVPIVGLEPSCILSLRDEYPELVPGDDAKAVAERSVLLEELEGLELHFADKSSNVLVHGHCHLKALVGTGPLTAFLQKMASDVTLVDSGCCGMAGSFGYEQEHFDVSLQMAERRLLPAVRNAGDGTVIVAPGTSCRHQIADATGLRALHPAELAAKALA